MSRERYSHKVGVSSTTIRKRARSLTVHLPVDDSHPFAPIGARLVLLRRYMGGNRMNQRAWAARHGFNDTQLSNWETGARRIPVDHAEALADRYGVTLDWIYRGRLDGLSEILRKIL
jgi:hypothetical protein